jgi:hypothetical protein
MVVFDDVFNMNVDIKYLSKFYGLRLSWRLK